MIPAAIAASKGRSFWGWWFFGATFFILALPLSILVGRNTLAIERKEFESGRLQKCPYCAEFIKIEAKVCKHCGRDLSFSDKNQEQQNSQESVELYLSRAESLARQKRFEEGATILESALTLNPTWASRVAGYPKQTSLAQVEPISGYALLVHLAGRTGNRKAALQYFIRMLDLAPERPGDARQAAREAGIENNAKKIAKARGISWRWWEY